MQNYYAFYKRHSFNKMNILCFLQRRELSSSIKYFSSSHLLFSALCILNNFFVFSFIITTNSTRTNHQQSSELVFTCTVVKDNNKKKKSCSCLPIIFKSISHKIPIFISMEKKRIKTAAAAKEKKIVWQVFHSHNSEDKMLNKKKSQYQKKTKTFVGVFIRKHIKCGIIYNSKL